ncbi:uncharacterized protein MYCFIDRAFT_33518 [Pseudocercospora fijiensis CIRAD86]|uniref:DJ-1/PfpI domain-containing protein n=1 Tax=Pseudocercospora fijiensis (strain CIRAD86) TaxID=383855 RepID=M3A0V1_PSEFD|nr:uncharacterized protein MYCFIDRAFT_33518 [Pseudocercospora fijiensis CIRAD86]EME78036.1 hypothetical protein MYCFIDRAFT_33518 [Pseudocercospora fijiensis CIRAD86]
MPTKRLEILAIAFAGLNIMDLTGPSEVFGSSRIPTRERRITIASSQDTIASSEGIILKRQVSLLELLATKSDGSIELSRYEILVMPGAPPGNVQKAIEDDENLLAVLRTFAGFGSSGGRHRWILSVCTGAAFLGTIGALSGKTATCHWSYLDTLREICRANNAPGEETNVVRKRWVDTGRSPTGVRIITAGGVSCGIDAALWILSELFSMEKAREVAKGMDYDWKFGKNEFTEGWVV